MKIKSLLPLLALSLAPLSGHATNSPYLSCVYEFMPAPGQFVNVIPEYEDGDSYEKLLEQISESLCGAASPGMISLGAYGGYVVVGFDHAVVNVPGQYDFKIAGNATISDLYSSGGSCEPGIVMVAMDTNGDGIPNDTWYELAGSDYLKDSTLHNYEITYYKPDENKVKEPDSSDANINDMTYIRWTSNDPDEPEGYVMRNIWHNQSYWPQWYEGESITFRGTRLAKNATNMGTDSNPYFLLSFCEWGYADNLPNSRDEGFDISWAVDENGESVTLPKIDFIKIYTGLNQYCGWLGETSTEVCGATDLHPDAVAEGGFAAITSEQALVNVYNLQGTLLRSNVLKENATSGLPEGIYLVGNKKVLVRK